ncbi:MAG: hypothetical protein RLY97_776, partial [Pseudomonadota bacterium]
MNDQKTSGKKPMKDRAENQD